MFDATRLLMMPVARDMMRCHCHAAAFATFITFRAYAADDCCLLLRHALIIIFR